MEDAIGVVIIEEDALLVVVESGDMMQGWRDAVWLNVFCKFT